MAAAASGHRHGEHGGLRTVKESHVIREPMSSGSLRWSLFPGVTGGHHDASRPSTPTARSRNLTQASSMNLKRSKFRLHGRAVTH